MRSEGTQRPLTPGVEFAVFRALQEALTNVRRHARATRVEVTLAYGPTEVVLRVSDDCCGCTQIQEGVGLVGIRARARELGGELVLHSRAGAGWILAMRMAA